MSSQVALENPSEDFLVKDLLTSAALATSSWMGLTDADSEGRYIWSGSGSETTYFDWATSEPTGSDEDCVYFDGQSANRWADAPCGAVQKPCTKARFQRRNVF